MIYLHTCCGKLFNNYDSFKLEQRLHHQKQICLITAWKESELAGFKLGYALDQTTFYSWMGGVLEPYRRQGIARQLSELQHQWAKEQGFAKLRTKSKNQFKPMMHLNLQQGFDIIGTEPGREGEIKIVFEINLGQ